jgi:hypothetical protein
MDTEMLRYLTHAACNRIDKLIDAMPKPATEANFADVNHAIERVRLHLDARLAQTAVPFIPPTSDLGALGTAEMDPEMRELLGL